MAHRRNVKVRSYEESTLLDADNSHSFDSHIHFYSGVPRENASNRDRLAERSLLQGGQSGMLDDRVAIDAEEEEF